jgi:riboflavin synthase
VFTGIIEEVGALRGLRSSGRSAEVEVEAAVVLDGTRVGDSIATSGVCLTVTRLGGDRFWADAQPETVRRTTLADKRPGDRLNLERALAVGGRLGGHLVQGHIDGVGSVTAVRRDETALVVDVRAPREVARLCVAQGSIAVDGVSLTLVDVTGDVLRVSLIPITAADTTLAKLRAGDRVNLEADLIGKYVATFLARGRAPAGEGLTWQKLAEAGF